MNRYEHATGSYEGGWDERLAWRCHRSIVTDSFCAETDATAHVAGDLGNTSLEDIRVNSGSDRGK